MAGHRYWRIQSITNDYGSYVCLAEVLMATSAGGPNVCSGGTASASTSYDAAHDADKALDGSAATWWSSSGNNTDWWQYDFGVGVTPDILEVKLTPRIDVPTTNPSSFLLEYSDDGVTFYIKQTFVAATWVSGTLQTFAATATRTTYADSGGHRYWRVYAATTSGGGNTELNAVIFRRTVGGPDISATFVGAIASSTYSTDQFRPEFVFDGVASSKWAANASAPQWIGADFGSGSAPAITEVVITAAGPTLAPSTGSIQYSDDNVTWSTAYSLSPLSWVSYPTQTFDAPTPTTINTAEFFFMG